MIKQQGKKGRIVALDLDDERVISGKEFLRWLWENGVIPYWTTGVVIEADIGSVVTMTVQSHGTNRLLEVKPPEFKVCLQCGNTIVAEATECPGCGGKTWQKE